MMTCAQVAELARQHTDGPLPMGMRVHLAMCKHCRRYLRQLRATVALLGGLDDAAAADDEAPLDPALAEALRARRGE